MAASRFFSGKHAWVSTETYNVEQLTRDARILLVKLHLVADFDEEQHAGILLF